MLQHRPTRECNDSGIDSMMPMVSAVFFFGTLVDKSVVPPSVAKKGGEGSLRYFYLVESNKGFGKSFYFSGNVSGIVELPGNEIIRVYLFQFEPLALLIRVSFRTFNKFTVPFWIFLA